MAALIKMFLFVFAPLEWFTSESVPIVVVEELINLYL
jgi:hypothetical protein